MSEPTHLPSPDMIDGFDRLGPEEKSLLRAMAGNMTERGLPNEVIVSGLRSTIRLLLEQQEQAAPRAESQSVQRFLEENHGSLVTHASRAVPRRESKLQGRERLRDQLTDLVRAAHSSKRTHEIKRIRRQLLGVDQNHVRRTLGADGDMLLRDINAWLIDVAPRVHEP